MPPDDLGPEGQLWGNPTYDWAAMGTDGYAWWMARFERMVELYDYVRLDHFLGFSSFYVVPRGKTALDGFWRYGPGRKLFEQARERLGRPLPFVAENLGTVTPAVRALVASCGFPGMDVIQFADEDPRRGYRPAPGSVAYLGTHDTSTLIGWCERSFGLPREEARALAERLAARTVKEVSGGGGVVMLQLQDVLGLGDEARMNVPGVAEGNWSWQAPSLD